MKKEILIASFMLAATLSAVSAIAQKKSRQKTIPASEPVQKIPVIKNLHDSASYALGLNLAQSLKKDLGQMSTRLILQAMENEFSGEIPLFDSGQMRQILQSYSEKARAAEAKQVIDAGRAFLQQNKSRPQIRTTASGLQYEVQKEGNGIRPHAADTVVVHYRGTLINGTPFDASYDRNEPLTIALNSVIKGWTEGVQLMSAGAKYRFFIPYELGYGLRGAPPVIPGGSALVFEIELLEVKPAR